MAKRGTIGPYKIFVKKKGFTSQVCKSLKRALISNVAVQVIEDGRGRIPWSLFKKYCSTSWDTAE